MGLSVDTGHALYANLVSLVVVDDDGVIKDIKTGDTFTVNGSASYGTGTFGRHLRTTNSSTLAAGAKRSSVVPFGTSGKPNGTVFMALNSFQGSSATTRPGLLACDGFESSSLPVPCVENSTGKVSATAGTTNVGTFPGTASITTGAHSLAITRTGQSAREVYVDGTLDSSGGQLGTTGLSNAGWNYIGGYAAGGYGYAKADFNLIATFDKVLNSTEIAALHASLTGSNAFSMIVNPPTATLGYTMDAAVFAGDATVQSDATLEISLDAAVWSGSAAPEPAAGSATLWTSTDDMALSLSAGVNPGIIVSEPIVNNTDGLTYANATGIRLWVYDRTSGALIADRTGLTTNGSGVLTITDTYLIGGTQYLVVGRMSDGAVFCAEPFADVS